MSRPISVPRWAVYVLLFGLYLTLRGYQSLDGDQAYRLPLLLHRQDPNLFADDPFVRAFDAFNPHRGYLALLDLASRPLGLSFGLFALFAGTFGLTCFGVSRLARSAWPGLGPGVGLVAVALLLTARAGNIGTNHLFEPMLLDRLIGFGLGWVALAWAIEGGIWRPSVLLGLAAVVHPSVGLQLGGWLGAAWIAWALAGRWTGQTWRATLFGLAALALALIPGALPNLLQGRRLFEGLSPEEFRRLGVELQMAQHMVPSLWRRPQWLAWGAYLAVAVLSLAPSIPRPEAGPDSSPDDAERTGEGRVRFVLLFGVLLAGLGLAYGMVEVVGDLRATVFQPFRMATTARGLALVALAGRCVMLWRGGTLPSRSRALLLGVGLTGDWAFVVAAAVEAAASLREALPTGHPKALAGLAAFGLLGYGLTFLSRHDTEQGQWRLMAALLAAVVVGSVARRLRAGWTGRRLAFATALCWSFPLAAAVVPRIEGPDGKLSRSLAKRCRFGSVPLDDVERLALWARANTPADARFITPPGPKTFRLWSGRSVAFNRAASPYHAAGLKDWSDRFRAHVGFEGTTDEFVRAYLADRHGLERRYDRLTPEGLGRLAASQGAGYILAPRPGPYGGDPGPLRLLRAEGRYAIYRIDPGPQAANAESPSSRR